MPVSKFFKIRSCLSGLVLDVAEGCNAPGASVITYFDKSEDFDNQLFYEERSTGTIRTKLNDFALEQCGDSIVVQPYNDGFDQKWRLNGNRISHMFNEELTIDLADCNENPEARICAWDYNGGENQHWTFEYAEPNYFYITSELNGKVIDIKGGVGEEGQKVIMWERKDGGCDNQLWYEDQIGIIRSKLCEMVLDSARGSVRIECFDYGSQTQQWAIDGPRICNRNDPSQVLDIKKANEDDGAKLCAWDYNEGSNQHWSLEYV